jgi:HAD superfamily hydrolase (TIGR01509 family)
MRCIVLDAMGVLFRAADDVVDILIPFIREHGGDAESAAAAYLEASLGTMGPDQFWRNVGLDPSVEDAYLSRHSLMPGAEDFLRRSQHARVPVWCLSNDVGRWSIKLRRRFDLDGLLAGAVISSDVRARKPDRAIYQCLIERSGFRPEDLFFVDDRTKNVEAAVAMGISSIRFDPGSGYPVLMERVFPNIATTAAKPDPDVEK